MQLAGWLRSVVWGADDWRASLRGALDRLRAKPDAARALDLGRALEHAEPDRRAALEAYRIAWRAGSAGALAAARRLAREVRAHGVAADLAMEEHERSGDPAALLAAACAWIDGGEPERAVRPLATANRALGDERITKLGAACVGELPELRSEVMRRFERATQADDPAAAVHAARIARAGGLPEESRTRLLRLAFDRWPQDDELAAQVEDLLLGRGDADELLTFYRLRLGTRQGARAWADEVRAQSSRLCVRGIAPGLGLRLARRGLEHAYDAGLVDVPGHLASWAMLADHARAIRATRELMPLAVQALRLGMPDDDRLWLARLGLEVAWRDAKDADAATAYAAVVIELAPEHPDVREFVAAQDFEIEMDEPVALIREDPTIAEIAMSLVYLDEHGGRLDDIAASAKLSAGLAAAAQAPPAPPAAPVDSPWTELRTTGSITAVAAEAVEAVEAVVALVEAAPSEPVPVPVPLPVPDPKPVVGPVIPTAALAALRRIGARVRAPTMPPLPGGLRDRAIRVVVPVDATVELDDGTKVQAVVRDLSLTGLYLVLKADLAIGAEVTIDLGIPGADALATSRHRAWARVARRGDSGYGLELLDPEPELVEAIARLTDSMK